MSIYTKLAANYFFPLHEKIKGHSTIEVHRQMEESQWLSSAQLHQLQQERLKSFLCDISTNVPYYRRLFSELDFDPSSVENISDLRALPLLQKADIREHAEQLKAVNTEGLQRFNTGGSTGEPLVFFIGKKRVSHDVAAKRRATRWWGVDIGDPETVVWGSPIELGSQDILRMVRDKIFRTQLLSAFEMSEKNILRFISEIRRRRPKMLFGYPSSLALIAEAAADKGCSMDNLGIKVAFVTSEKLYKHQRELIQDVFGCPVANGYGGRDAGFIAHECSSGSMHITSEDIVVEIVDEKGRALESGESGEIVVTHLATNDFPFVRYATGDIGVVSDRVCSCGRGLQILETIEGRTTDFVVSQDGTKIHGLALIYILRDLPEIKTFKIVQQSIDQVDIQLVTSASDRVGLEDIISRGIQARLGENVTVRFDHVDEIARERSGKFRYVSSKLATPSDGS